MPRTDDPSRLTKVYLHLDRLADNMRLLQQQAGGRELWPCIKANAYGHGADIIARHLYRLGYTTFCVADVGEAMALLDAGVDATFIVLSAMLTEHIPALVKYGCEPVLCTHELVDALAEEAERRGKRIAVHIKVDSGMGRIGIRPEQLPEFVSHCRARPSLRLRGIMSHFACADEEDKAFSYRQIENFNNALAQTQCDSLVIRHMANSAAIFDLPKAGFDACRPGISIYGLRPSHDILNPAVNHLKPVLEWKTRIVYLKEVASDFGLSYGRTFITDKPSLIATVPLGYGDGFSRRLSNNVDLLIGGQRCPQVGRITMDMSLVDVTELRGTVNIGDEAVIIGEQNGLEIGADELAAKLGTINYEIVTAISQRSPRIVV
ncbi:alanine racemase [Methylomarinum vadi]|uniref:alanine racemase n=1 Tax=Methylomarinum vadi TaxID=438855 RepID=UPI00068A5A83|nr:alanine racemase [Methylomarinum vadi]